MSRKARVKHRPPKSIYQEYLEQHRKDFRIHQRLEALETRSQGQQELIEELIKENSELRQRCDLLEMITPEDIAKIANFLTRKGFV